MGKLTLIRPPTVVSPNALGEDALPPIGLAYLASSVREAGHSVEVVDAVGEALDRWEAIDGWPYEAVCHGLPIPEVVSRIADDTDVVGVSCMFSVAWPFTRLVIEAIRNRFPKVSIVVGGEHVTAAPAFTLETCGAIDYCVLGEGEGPLVSLMTVLEAERSPKHVLSRVAGIMGRVDGRASCGPPPERIRAIDEIPDPEWSLFPIDNYLDGGFMHGVNLGRSMPLLASRGCPYSCTFCSSPQMWTTLWNARKPENVIREMKRYIEQYRATNFDFYDLTAIVKKSWIVEFATLVAQELPGITWQLPSGTRSEAIDAEVTALLYKSGCRHINYAPESGNPRVLKRIKKQVKPERMLQSMRSAYASGLVIKANIMAGLPGEQKRDVIATLKFIVRMALLGVQDVCCVAYCPYPGSELFNRLQKAGRVTLDDAFLMSLAYYTIPGRALSYSEHMSNTFVRLYTNFAMGLFYAVSFARRPIRAWGVLRNIVLRKSPQTRLEKGLAQIFSNRRNARARLDRPLPHSPQQEPAHSKNPPKVVEEC